MPGFQYPFANQNMGPATPKPIVLPKSQPKGPQGQLPAQPASAPQPIYPPGQGPVTGQVPEQTPVKPSPQTPAPAMPQMQGSLGGFPRNAPSAGAGFFARNKLSSWLASLGFRLLSDSEKEEGTQKSEETTNYRIDDPAGRPKVKKKSPETSKEEARTLKLDDSNGMSSEDWSNRGKMIEHLGSPDTLDEGKIKPEFVSRILRNT